MYAGLHNQPYSVVTFAIELADIDAALERLYRAPERFGICKDSGRPIPLERLEVVPWARTCEQPVREGDRMTHVA